MTSAAIYARVSSARQKEQETIVSQTEALRAHAGQLGLDVPEQWVFEDDGYSGASLVRPALEALRDLVAQVPVDVVLCHSPDRLARKYAYQALLIEEPARAGTSVVFVKAPRGDRSRFWRMLRSPAYAGGACFGKTGRLGQQAGRNRVARQAGPATGAAYTTVDRPRGDWLEIDVPALVDEATFERVARRLADNKKFASRASKTPSLLQGLAACSGCGYACYRGHTTTSAGNKIFYYRCIGSDNYRFEHGKVCDSKPVRADYLDQVVWDHITHLIADPALIRAEIGNRLAQIRTADPATAQRKRLEDAPAKTPSAITRLIGAYQEDLVSLDDPRPRRPDLRAPPPTLPHPPHALPPQPSP